jgi:hypothetical protein
VRGGRAVGRKRIAATRSETAVGQRGIAARSSSRPRRPISVQLPTTVMSTGCQTTPPLRAPRRSSRRYRSWVHDSHGCRFRSLAWARASSLRTALLRGNVGASALVSHLAPDRSSPSTPQRGALPSRSQERGSWSWRLELSREPNRREAAPPSLGNDAELSAGPEFRNESFW